MTGIKNLNRSEMQDRQLQSARSRVEVALGDRRYDIDIGDGLLGQAGRFADALEPGARAAIIADANIAGLYGQTVCTALEASGIEANVLRVAPGEGSKSFAEFERLSNAVLSLRLERRDFIVALGGGVVGDLAGFVAASVRRGMSLMQIPTSLLAQVDSSIGGKTAINTSLGKNLVGAFFQPRHVLIDTSTLDSLPIREFRAGYAELAKYGLIDNADFFAWLEHARTEIFSGGPARSQAIEMACRAKAAIVADDEREMGRRALLNLGHTFAHALEAAVNYASDWLVHGEAVAIGLVLAHRFSVVHAGCPSVDCARVETHLAEAGLPTKLKDISFDWPDAAALVAFMEQDKKVMQGQITMILTHGIGEAFVSRNVSRERLVSFLTEEIERS